MTASNFTAIDTGNGAPNTGSIPANCKQITVIGIGPSGTAFGADSGATITVNSASIKVVQGIPLNFSYESGFWPALTYAKGTADRLIIYYVYN
jgi:hypothetical protein